MLLLADLLTTLCLHSIIYCENNVYEVKLIYPKVKQFEPSLTYKESMTHCATVELFLQGIYTSQASATRIVFESERDRLLGVLILSGKSEYTVQIPL